MTVENNLKIFQIFKKKIFFQKVQKNQFQSSQITILSILKVVQHSLLKFFLIYFKYFCKMSFLKKLQRRSKRLFPEDSPDNSSKRRKSDELNYTNIEHIPDQDNMFFPLPEIPQEQNINSLVGPKSSETFSNSLIHPLLEDFDNEVQAKLKKLERRKEEQIEKLQRELKTQLILLPDSIKQMTLKEFFSFNETGSRKTTATPKKLSLIKHQIRTPDNKKKTIFEIESLN